MNKLQFKFDYLNGIVPITRVDSFFESLRAIDDCFELSNWVNSCFAVRGIRNYNTRYHFMGENNFIVSWNCANEYNTFIAKTPDESKFNPYIYITISGQALEYFSEYSLEHFFKYLYRIGFKATRFDIACDIYNRDNAVVQYIIKSFKSTVGYRPEGVPFVVSKMSLKPRKNKKSGRFIRPVQYTTVSDINGNLSENLTFGDHSSPLGMFRMYDKYLERGYDTFENTLRSSDPLFDLHKKLFPEAYCYRLECELHHEHARALFNLMIEKNLPIYDVFASALCSMFEIRVARSQGYLSQFCSVAPLWQEFIAELSTSIHLVELDGKKESLSVCQLPIEELKEKLLHYAPMLCAFADLCYIEPDFLTSVVVGERYRYDNKMQYEYLRRRVDKRTYTLNNIVEFNEKRCKYGL